MPLALHHCHPPGAGGMERGHDAFETQAEESCPYKGREKGRTSGQEGMQWIEPLQEAVKTGGRLGKMGRNVLRPYKWRGKRGDDKGGWRV